MRNSLIAFVGAVRAVAFRLVRHRRSPAIVAGFAFGIAGWSAAHPFVAAFGFNRGAIAGLMIAAAGSFAAGLSVSQRRPGLAANGLPALFAAAWLVLSSAILPLAVAAVAAVPVAWLAIDWVGVPALTLAGLTAFGLPAFCTGIVTGRFIGRGDSAVLLTATGAGVLANALLLAPAIGLQIPLLTVSVAAAVWWFAGLLRGTAAPSVVDSPKPAASSAVAISLGAAVVGAGCALSGRVVSQLMPEAGYLLATGVAAFLVGGGLGLVLDRRLRHRMNDGATIRRLGAVLAVCSVLLPLAAFPWLVDRQLDANAYVSSVAGLSALRIATVAAVLLPLGVGCALMSAQAGRPGLVAASLAGGLVAAGWLIPAAGVVPLALALSGGLLTADLGRLRLARSRSGWAATAICGAVLAVAAFGAGRYEPARAARILFSTEVFLSRQGGVPRELLPYLDDVRLVAKNVAPNGTLTVWKQRGETSVVRRDGIPIATTSRRPDRCPLPSADVMRVALPLILHEDAESVLLLGDPVRLATRIAVGFPVRKIVCYDAADGVAGFGIAESADDRVSATALEPRLALAAERRNFDVIVSDPGTPMVLDATPYFSREFYVAAAERLTEDGIFCQRLRYADYGPEPLRVIAATMTEVFGEVMTIEIGSGEYAVLGVRPGGSLVREGLLDRLKRPHVRRTLAALGWDWCVPLNLTTVEQEGMALLAAEAAGVNSDANGRLAYSLPQESMRWGAKWRELQQATAGRTSRLFVRGVPAEDQQDVLYRIAEVTGQHRLMTAFPDQPWAYRKELKATLTEKPRSVIRQVAGEVRQARHPDDSRRIEYFKALGEAIRETTPQTLADVERFAAPYDPLLTYFLHHEIAPLYAELGKAGAAAEFTHRLYAAYYADPRDRSVRDAVAAIELLVARPELVPTAADRFDHLNGLIEVLLGRWEARGMNEPRSPEIVTVDIDKSLDAAEAAVGAMGPLAEAAGLSGEDWRLRKAAIERTLTRPLRKYRTSLLPYLRAAQKKSAEAAETSGEEG